QSMYLSHLPIIEPPDVAGDHVETVLHRKVSGVQPMHFGAGQILQVGLTAFAGEEDIVLTPKDQRPWLPVAQELLPLRIEIDVGPVVVEQVELYAMRIRTLHKP